MSINKNVYEEKKLRRGHLQGFTLVILLLGLAILAGGIVLLVFGCKANTTSTMALEIIAGVIMIVIGLGASGTAIAMLFVSFGMTNVRDGSVKDGNSAIGTANVKLCDKCGHELEDGDKVCPNCGKEIE